MDYNNGITRGRAIATEGKQYKYYKINLGSTKYSSSNNITKNQVQAIQTGGGFVRLITTLAYIFAMCTLTAIATIPMLADLTGLPLAFQSSIIMQSNVLNCCGAAMV